MSGGILSEWINRQIKFFPVFPVHWTCWCCCPHTSQAPVLADGVFRQRGKDTHYCIFYFFLLSSTERTLLTPSRIRQVKCAVFRQLLPLLSPSISPQGHQSLQARSGSHKQVVPSAHCGSPPSTSITLTLSLHLTVKWQKKEAIKKKGGGGGRFSQSLTDASGFQS